MEMQNKMNESLMFEFIGAVFAHYCSFVCIAAYMVTGFVIVHHLVFSVLGWLMIFLHPLQERSRLTKEKFRGT
jgi:hypothetical protein